MMVYVNKTMFHDAVNRRNKCREKDVTLEELFPREDILKGKAFRMACCTCYFAHGAFIVGVFVGGFAYLCSPPPN
ncbi:MAG: hypothetical protein AABY49_06045 [Planctomycetota bacterium]